MENEKVQQRLMEQNILLIQLLPGSDDEKPRMKGFTIMTFPWCCPESCP